MSALQDTCAHEETIKTRLRFSLGIWLSSSIQRSEDQNAGCQGPGQRTQRQSQGLWRLRPWTGRHTTHHALHHRRSDVNYGLYFPWWDWVMKTTHPAYEEKFDEVTTFPRDAERA